VQEQGFYSLLFLAQAWQGEGLPAAHVTVATNGMTQVADEPVAYPEKATVLGPARVLPRELSGMTCATVDLVMPVREKGWFGATRIDEPALDEVAELVWEELQQSPRNAVVAHRTGKRFEQIVERMRTPEPREDIKGLRDGGVYLITGGFGGIGQTIATHLATAHHAKLALVGRSNLPPAAQWDAWIRGHAPDDSTSRRIRQVRELEALGAEVLVVSADVTDLVAMTQALDKAQRRFGALNGVIHAAGVLRDGLIASKSQSDIEEVFTPKIHGTLVLDELLRDIELDFVIVFSSTSTAIAPAGQVDYVAANAFLNAYAQSRSVASRRQTVALNWGIWSEVGMAVTGRNPAASHAPACEPASHPLFETRCGDQHAEHVVLSAKYSPATHWLLDEHRTAAGHALIPGTGYLELMRAALVELGVRQPFEIADLYFLRPLYVADSATKDVRVKLQRDDEGYWCAIQSRVQLDDGRAGWEQHAQARLLLDALPEVRRVPVAEIDARCKRHRQHAIHSSLHTRQEEHLRFGPRWHVLREVAYGDGEAIAKLELPDAYRGDLQDFALHPALMDLATGYAMDLIAGYDQCHDLWVPVSYAQMRVYGPLPQHVVSWVRNHGDNRAERSIATFDITITDETGRVLVEIREFSIKRLPKSDSFALAPTPSAAEVELETTDAAHERQPSAGDEVLAHNLCQGIKPAEGIAALERVLRSGISPQVIVSSLDVPGLITQTDRLIATQEREHTTFTRPKLESEFIAPRDDIERTLAGIWQELLGVNEVGIHDNFFELGGHSLIAVRLFAKIKKTFAVDFPMSILFEAPTIAGCADLIRESGQHRAPTGDDAPRESHRTRYAHLVAMHDGNGAHERPLFIVAGMFGNVLNLRHLAHLVGQDRPCYGLQARGLYGEHPPHETFEEAATEYLRELRTVQPHGPYLLGGFSGGGLHAYEMARQLIEQGEEVAMLVMLDTPLPVSAPLTFSDKLKMHLQKIGREKGRYFTRLIGNRIAWEIAKRRKKRARDQGPQQAQFHNLAIEAAFYRACTRYEVTPVPVTISLFRPKLNPIHVFGPDRMINVDRRFIYNDNGWSPFVTGVDVHEVPGDHDSMVLEPNVRVLGTKLRQTIRDIESRLEQANKPARPAPAPIVVDLPAVTSGVMSVGL
jgi:thioesterase domain-containing protein/NAD(P)-dependent dehydrogenase (short-subunit alcohol dehydrogenase family)/acyl carrier protein